MFGWSTTGLSTKANMLHFKTRSLEINPAYMAVRLMKALRRARSGVGWLASRLISSLRCEGFACWLVASLRSTARARNLLFLLVMFAVQAGFSGPPSPTGYGVTKFTRKARKFWWRQTGSNRRPQACKASALPTELCPRRRSQERAMAWQARQGVRQSRFARGWLAEPKLAAARPAFAQWASARQPTLASRA